MRTERPNTRRPALVATLTLAALPFFAQSPTAGSSAAPAPAASPMPMEVNYVLLALAIVQVLFILSLSGVLRMLIHPSTGWMKRLKGGGGVAVLLPLLLFSAQDVHAQAYVHDSGTFTAKGIFWWLLSINLLLFLLLITQVGVLRTMTGALVAKEAGSGVASVTPAGPNWAQRVMKRLTRQVELEREEDVLMHHDYDGIRELDNVLPPWWVWLFYGSILWGIVYLVNVHVIRIWPDQKTGYTQEMEQARADVAAYMATLTNLVDENNAVASTDAATLANGKATFAQYCVACHLANGEGNVGPNLTDAYWIHGGGIKNIFKTIKYGVAEKGMISWQSQLKPSEIQAVASYILSLQGTNPPNAKAPQGTLWQESAPLPDSTVVGDSAAVVADTSRATTP